MTEPIALPRYTECFVCGRDNPIGLDVTFYYQNGRIETAFTPHRAHTGYQDVVHGGVLAALLDECMGWTSILSRCVMCYTAELTLRYKESVKPGNRLLIYGELHKARKRIITARGAVELEDGTIVCAGEGKYIPLSEEEMKEVCGYANWGDRFQNIVQQIHALRE